MSTDEATIVAMTVAHIDLLMPYEKAMFGREAWTSSGYRAELADTRHRTYFAAEGVDGQLLGWAGVRVLADEAEILTVGVVPDARRRGIARRLLTSLLDTARAAGASDVYLEVRFDNASARALYEFAGFADVGVRRGYYDGGRTDAAVMHLSFTGLA